MKTGLIELVHFGHRCLTDDHPETPERMQSALDYIHNSDIASEFDIISVTLVDESILSKVHSSEYLKYLESLCNGPHPGIDEDNYLTNESYNLAKITALTSAKAAEMIFKGERKSIFIAGRPPGHHAEYNRAMGFCLINNAAVAAEYLIRKFNLKRIAIIDWDVHHGNGTQNLFYNRSDVYYFSLHQHSLFPGTGLKSEIGNDVGKGYTMNIPLSPGTDDNVYLKNFEEKVIPALENYKPEFIIISCGFDAHREDSMSAMNLSETAYGAMTRMIRIIADEYCEGKILSLFEGGYNPDSNGRSLNEHLKELI